MSIYNCIKSEVQPWASWVAKNKIQYEAGCCTALVTTKDRLLPFQIVSKGDYIKAEIAEYGTEVWSEITLSIDTVIAEGYFIHSYDGSLLASELDCGMYDFKVTAFETWYFEPILVEDFTISTNAYTKRDIMMTPLKFAEMLIDGVPIIAPIDRFLPFMYATENASTAPTVYLYDIDGNTTELVGFTLDVSIIDNLTYYYHDGGCLAELLACGTYRLKIVDGAFTYYSVWFEAEADINDIPDGYVALRDVNGCVMRDESGAILYESCRIPTEPTSLSAIAISSSEIDLTWVDESSTEDGFKIERSEDNSTFVQIAVVSAGEESFSDTALDSSTTYYYRVRAYNADGESDYSNTAHATTETAATVPDAPTIGTATAGNTQASVAFTPPANDGGSAITGYTATSNPSAITGAGASSPIVVTGLTNGTAYTFTVTATNAIGTSVPSAASNSVTPLAPPAAPSSLSATTISSSRIDLAWTDNSSNETGFKIERSLNGSSWSQIDTVGAGVTAYQSTGLDPSTLYYYRVRAYNAAGDSAYSNTASDTTDAAGGTYLTIESTPTEYYLSGIDQLGGLQYLSIESDGAWEGSIVSDPDGMISGGWTDSGVGDDTLTIGINPNFSTDPVSAEIEYHLTTNPAITITLYLCQDGTDEGCP